MVKNYFFKSFSCKFRNILANEETNETIALQIAEYNEKHDVFFAI